MSIFRKGESGTRAERGARFFQKDSGDWYFHTREKIDLGPYDSCIEAHRGLKDYLEFVNRADTKTAGNISKANVA